VKRVIACCTSGLGNRLMSLIGGYFFARKEKCELDVLWEKTSECDCDFNKIFKNKINFIDKEELLQALTNKSYIYGFGYNNYQKSYILSMLCKYKKTHIKNDNRWNAANLQIDHTHDVDVIVFNDISIPPYIPVKDVLLTLENLNIQDCIESEITEFIKRNRINKDTQGILLRKTDFKQIYNNDLIDDFIFYNDICNNKHQRFFITSDDRLTEEKFTNLQNVVILTNKKFPEQDVNNNINRTEQSVIDGFKAMQILSRTTIKANTQHSSFAKIASYYNLLYDKQG
jgi:hypothetical protein